MRIAIVGPPNAGKSSLLNLLAGHEAAIVSPVPGTTRDLVQVQLELGGVKVGVGGGGRRGGGGGGACGCAWWRVCVCCVDGGPSRRGGGGTGGAGLRLCALGCLPAPAASLGPLLLRSPLCHSHQRPCPVSAGHSE